jgi:hypothetical protein
MRSLIAALCAFVLALVLPALLTGVASSSRLDERPPTAAGPAVDAAIADQNRVYLPYAEKRRRTPTPTPTPALLANLPTPSPT